MKFEHQDQGERHVWAIITRRHLFLFGWVKSHIKIRAVVWYGYGITRWTLWLGRAGIGIRSAKDCGL